MSAVPVYRNTDPSTAHRIMPGVETQPIHKPQPETDPIVFEISSLLPTTKRFALFSGGDDSLVTTHYAMEHGWVDCVVYLATNSGLAQNIDFVRRVCAEYRWPLLIVRSPMELEPFFMRYGPPGSTDAAHGWAYRYFKGRQLRSIATTVDGYPLFFTGVHVDESGRRRVNIEAEVQWEDSETGDFKGWWVSPLYDKSQEWFDDYRERHGLPRNQIKDTIHRSGDCFCMAFGHRDEVLVDLAAHYPRHFYWLMNIERRTQEYRGRLLLLQDHDPDLYDRLNEKRKEPQPPYRMRMIVAQDYFPDAFRWMMGHHRREAIQRAMREPTNWIGHGGMASEELRALTREYDPTQPTLCEACGVPDPDWV